MVPNYAVMYVRMCAYVCVCVRVRACVRARGVFVCVRVHVCHGIYLCHSAVETGLIGSAIRKRNLAFCHEAALCCRMRPREAIR